MPSEEKFVGKQQYSFVPQTNTFQTKIIGKQH
jgi:hypothetical protein